MMSIRKSQDRGHAEHGWLDTCHTFSFADYYDPNFMAFKSLRVINEDKIEGGEGFPPHSHKNMEIITYIVSGSLEHKDSMGNTAVIRPGEVQYMSAGTGVQHSEFNHEIDRPTHLLQIWILPKFDGAQPGYGQKDFSQAFAQKNLTLVCSHDGREGSIKIGQDADLFVGRTQAQDKMTFKPSPKNGQWIQVIKGRITVNGQPLSAGDGVAILKEAQLDIASEADSEFLFFDLA